MQQLPFPQGMQTFHAVATLQQEQHPLYIQHTKHVHALSQQQQQQQQQHLLSYQLQHGAHPLDRREEVCNPPLSSSSPGYAAPITVPRLFDMGRLVGDDGFEYRIDPQMDMLGVAMMAEVKGVVKPEQGMDSPSSFSSANRPNPNLTNQFNQSSTNTGIQQSVGERTVAHPQLPPRHQRHLQQHMRPDDSMIDFIVSPMAALPVNRTPMHRHEAVVSQPQLQNAVEMDAHVQSTQLYSTRHRQLHGPVPDQRMYAQRIVPAGLEAPPAYAVPSPVGMMNATRIPGEVHTPVTTGLTLPFPTATDWSTQPPHGTAEVGHQQHGAGSTHAEDNLISFDF